MPRTPRPTSRTVPVALKVSPAKAEAIDAVRGPLPRAQWLEGLIDAALAAAGRPVSADRPSERASGRAPDLEQFLRAGPYEPLVTREQVLDTACSMCGAQPGHECDSGNMRPAMAGFVLRGLHGLHMRRYQDLAHDPR